MNLPRELLDAALAIADNIVNLELLTGRKPQLVSALALHLAHFFFPRASVNIKVIAEHTQTGVTSIRSVHKLLYPKWEQVKPRIP